MTSFDIVRWNDLFPPNAPPLAIKVKNALMDRSLVPLFDHRVSFDRLYYNPNKFYDYPGEGSPLFAGAHIADGRLTLGSTPKPTKRINGRAALIGSVSNFGHFVVNHLPRLAMALDLEIQADCYIVSAAPPFVMSFFEEAGIDPRRVVSVADNDIALVDDLLILPMQCCGSLGADTIYTTKSFPDRMRARFGRFAPEPKARLYLPRGETSWRRLLNEAEVIDALKPLGFEVFRPEGESVRRQMDVVGGAEMIVGPYGAAIQLACFAPKGAQVFYLGVKNIVGGGGEWSLASFHATGITMHEVHGVIAQANGDAGHNADFTIDPALVAAEVARAIASAAGAA